MKLDVEGRTVLVTGASSGIGAHFARLFCAEGARVVACARREDRLTALCAEIEAAGGTARPVVMDVTDPDSVTAAFAVLGEDGLDVLVNNAGITATVPALSIERDGWDAIVATNLTGTFFVAQAAARLMQAQGRGGSIVNIASILGLRVAGQVAAYAASKAAVVHYTKALALEWARYGIRVNALCPGYVETELNRDFFATDAGAALIRRIPTRRLGQPGDLDGALLLLASDAGAAITGVALAVDGGHLVSSL